MQHIDQILTAENIYKPYHEKKKANFVFEKYQQFTKFDQIWQKNENRWCFNFFVKKIVKIVEKIVNTDGRRVRAADFSVLEEKEAGTKRKSELSV